MGHSTDPTRPAPIGRVYGDDLLMIPREGINGDYQHVRFNISLPEYTICMSGKSGTILTSNDGDWHLGFNSADFGHGQRHSQSLYIGDHWQHVCATNHPTECHHIDTHIDVCEVNGGHPIEGLKLHSTNAIWSLQNLIIYDRHLTSSEILKISDFLWGQSRFESCEMPEGEHRGRRLSNGSPMKPLITLAEIEEEEREIIFQRNSYIFNATSEETFFTSASGITITIGSLMMVGLVFVRLAIFELCVKYTREAIQ